MTQTTAAQQERNNIRLMFDRAEDKRDYPGNYFPALHKADAALAAWRATYPDEANAEDAAKRHARADRKRQLAQGALHFSADGWYNAEARQKRHDEMMAEADAIERSDT